MAGYKAPKTRLHKDFVYLDHDRVLNSLSAFEAGKVDEIIEKTTDATDKGLTGAVGAGPVKAGGSKKRQKQVQGELVRTRTWFSSFDAWHKTLHNQEAIGTFSAWSEQVREQLGIGDTVEFVTEIKLHPLHMMFATFSSFARDAGNPDSVFNLPANQVAENRKVARMMETWVTGSHGSKSTAAYFIPTDGKGPRIVGRLEDEYLIGGLDQIDGTFTVVAQVDKKVDPGEQVSAIRVLRDVPPTPRELEVIGDALASFQGEPAAELGIELTSEDLALSHPVVIVRPLAIFK